jgi:RNA polymerase sigma-70 factor (sigma-E family)
MSRAERDAAFTAYAEARRTHLRRIAYALCGDWHRADDLVQTALVKLYVAWPRLADPSKAEAYARTILVRADIDESRRPWRRERAGLAGVDRPAPEDTGSDDRSEVFTALQALPVMQRRVVLLRHWLDLSVAETARELGIAEGTVKSHTSRGLATLQQLIATSRA